MATVTDIQTIKTTIDNLDFTTGGYDAQLMYQELQNLWGAMKLAHDRYLEANGS